MKQGNPIKGLIYSQYGTEAELARVLGWSRQQLNRLTTGAEAPDLDELAALSERLDTSYNDLIPLFLDIRSQNRQPEEIR